MPVLAAVMLIAVLLVVLVLAAQYESWSLPMAIVLIVPMCVLAALFGVWMSHFPPFGSRATSTSSPRWRWSCWSAWRARTRS